MPGMHDIRRKNLVGDTQNSNRSRTITRAGVHHIARLAGKVLVAFFQHTRVAVEEWIPGQSKIHVHMFPRWFGAHR